MFSKRTILLSQKGLSIKNFLNYESIIKTVESLCFSFAFKILAGSRDDMFLDEKMKNVRS